VLLIDAASFGVCAVLIALLVRVPGKSVKDDGEPEAYHAALRAGLAFLRGDRLVLGLMAMLFVTNMLDQGFSAVLVPLWARDIFGSPVGIGLVGGSFGAGAVLGNIAFTMLAPRLPRWGLFAVGFLVAGAPRYVVLAYGAPGWAIVALGLIDGVAIAAVNPILSAVMYERVPEQLQARVQGLGSAIAFAGMPLGALMAGWLGEYGAQVALLVSGGAYLLATLAPFVGKVWREMDVRPAGALQPVRESVTA
jgi:MFS family permease